MKLIALAIGLAAALTVVGTVAAQSPVVSAEVDRASATTDDIITLSVIVEGGNQVSQPLLPFLDGLVVIGSSSVSQISITNGKMVSNFLFEYRLVPTRTGKISIDPISIAVDGARQQTAPLELDVTQGAGRVAAPTPSPDFDFDANAGAAPSGLAGQDHYVEAGVDEPNPYLGQQLIYSRKYYVVRDPVRDTFFTRRSSELPAFDGFWHQNLSDEGRYIVEAAGRRYTVFEERTVLFPTLVGRLTIAPSVTRVSVSPLRPPEELATQSVLVDVRPLPAGAPAGFDGAVGDYRIEASVDSSRLSGGDPATLTVTVSGAGNIDALPEPNLPDSSDWRFFSQDSDSSAQVFQGELRGSRSFTYLLLPNTDGALQIPPIEYVYFDPVRETYVTMSTDPIRVEVEPGSIDIAAVQRANEAEPAIELDVVVPDRPRGLRPVDGALSTGGKGFTAPAWYWGLFALPVLLLLAVEGLRSRRRLARAWQAVGPGRGRDRSGRPYASSQGPSAPADRRLLDYLSGRLARPAGGLAGDRLATELGELGADPGLISDVRGVLDAGQAARFAPPALRDEIDEEPGIDDLIRRLDEAFQ